MLKELEGFDPTAILPTATWLATRFKPYGEHGYLSFSGKTDLDETETIFIVRWFEGYSEIALENQRMMERWRLTENYPDVLMLGLIC